MKHMVLVTEHLLHLCVTHIHQTIIRTVHIIIITLIMNGITGTDMLTTMVVTSTGQVGTGNGIKVIGRIVIT